jgi:2,3-bisphosphoglycerate-dependent phosphoglycerate mutase
MKTPSLPIKCIVHFAILQAYLLWGVSSLATSTSSNNKGHTHTLLLCRHGDSIWNGGQPGTQETFTGWTDVPLSQRGISEAVQTGEQLSSLLLGSGIDACFTSILSRAQLTAHHCLWAFGEKPSHEQPRKYVMDYRLNERHYGALQGFVKRDVENGKYGHDPDLVQQWRRSWHTVPPLLDQDDPRRLEEIRRFAHHCGGPDNVPRGESLEMVANNRIRPFLDDVLEPVLNQAAHRKKQDGGGTGLVVAHANSLRALIGVICNVQDDPSALTKLEALKIQTGVPLVLKFTKCSTKGYQVCDLPHAKEVLDIFPKQRRPDLPVWPLSCIPLFDASKPSEQLTSGACAMSANGRGTNLFQKTNFPLQTKVSQF